MRRVILDLPDEVVAVLERLAEARGISRSQVVRRGIEMQDYVQEVERDELRPGVFLVARYGDEPAVVEFP